MSDSIISRHRPLSLLAALILAQVLLLAFQIKRENNVRLVRYWAVQALTPVERAGTWSFSRISGLWSGYIGLRNARSENARLQKELDELRMRNRELESQAAEGQRLAALLSFRSAHPEASMLAAEVIGASADPTSHTLFINRGERDHVRRNLAVITPEGIVGKIVEVFPSSAQVLLINDKDSGVGALFATTRTHGVVKGSGDPNPRMDYIVNDEKVQAGDKILTSGEDHIFPKDLPVGIVESAKPGSPFQTIWIQPAARLDRLEEVLVLLTQLEVPAKKSEEGSASTPAAAGAKAAQPPVPHN
ncbi:MAG TPA: rod shape-determining protein MreC [Terriglobales bacterium]|nr:rod shape-determining protein MreC [Candidatus Acidoferrum sp.]HTR23967.1 rod shape-determining protein MreC [Terriglobales bacterium]